MLLTIDIKESAIDKIMYLLENLKPDVKIVENKLDIEPIDKDDEDYKYILESRKHRVKNAEDYMSLDKVNWD